MNAIELSRWSTEQGASSAFIEIYSELAQMLPPDVAIDDDIWNILPWLRSTRNSARTNIHFEVIQHRDLKILCKLWVLHARLTGRTYSLAAACFRIAAMEALSHVLGARPLLSLKTDDFLAAERWLRDGYASAFRRAGYLQQASQWLSISFNMRLEYRNRLRNPTVYGRYGTDAGRARKLIPIDVIRDLLNARHRDDLIAKDKFFLPVLVISVGTGFRVGELALLPADCLIKMKGGLHLLHFPEKAGKSVPRPIHPLLADVMEDAVGDILRTTSSAREIAKRMRDHPPRDWSRIFADDSALSYFTGQWAHEWTMDPTHRMINPNAAWYTKGNRFIDAIGALAASGGNQSEASRRLGISRATFSDLLATQRAARDGRLPPIRNIKSRGKLRESWDTDQRVISVEKFQRYCGIHAARGRSRVRIQRILDEARELQLQGKIFPAPAVDPMLERCFQRQIPPLLRNKDGDAILHRDEALLVVQKYALSEQRSTVETDFSSLTDGSIARWLSGEARSHGTGNHEDSVFSRLGITDPRTGKVAKFTIHDIRHWLNTIYQNGGLTEDQIALIFNRKYKAQNATYDQTSSKVRAARLKQAIRDKMVVGQVTDSYSRLAEFSREDADDYLDAVLRMVNPMPHGVCTLDWATTPCPHHLSCFSCRDELPCEHLIVDPGDKSTKAELDCMQREADLVIAAIRSQGIDSSPTVDHFKRIRHNVVVTLDKIGKIKGQGPAHG